MAQASAQSVTLVSLQWGTKVCGHPLRLSRLAARDEAEARPGSQSQFCGDREDGGVVRWITGEP